MMTQGKNLKSHHHIRVSHDMRQDLLMWQEFINHPSLYCRGFMDFDRTWNADQIEMYSDASKNPSLGFGGICEKFMDVWTVGQ